MNIQGLMSLVCNCNMSSITHFMRKLNAGLLLPDPAKQMYPKWHCVGLFLLHIIAKPFKVVFTPFKVGKYRTIRHRPMTLRTSLDECRSPSPKSWILHTLAPYRDLTIFTDLYHRCRSCGLVSN